MGRLSTCKLCGKKITKEEKYIYSNKSYCEKCYNIKLKEREDYEKLINAICSYFNINKPTGLILKQIKDYKEKFDFEYKWISYCLWYVTYILNKKLDIKFGIAIVKYEYENSKQYYEKQLEIRNSVKIDKAKEVIRKVTINNTSIKNKLLINLDEVN